MVASVPWAEPGSRFTRDFEAECAWLMTVANQKTVSGFLHVSWRTAGTVARRVAERVKASMPSPFDGLHAIGVDETSHRKGHTYITVVVDHERHRVIWAHDGVGGDVFDLFFKALTPEQHASIRVVTGDGARWIDPCVGRWRPNAERVLDGFHIVSWMTDALDKVRKRLWNQARRDGDEKTTKRMRGVKYAVLKTPGDLTFDMCRQYVDEVVTVTESEIASAILTVLEKQKLVAEGAGAVGIAAAMYHKASIEGQTVCALLSGGNVDVTMLERILTRGLAKEGRTVSFSTVLPDQPHALASFLEVVSSLGANVLDVNHERRNTRAAIGSCVVQLSLETRDKAHIQEIISSLRREGYEVEEQS